MPGCVIYVINLRDTKIIAGWDFLSLPNADQNLLWKPDLLILGAETYNDHPSTGLISISEAYNTIKRWNAKDCFIVHYSGEKDVEDAKNQWIRGPTKPLSTDELQKVIDSHRGITDAGGKFRMTVARQGMIWKPAADEDSYTPDSKLEIEALEKYVMSLEKLEDNKLNFIIEDSVNRLVAEFANPRKGGNGNILEAEPLKSMMMKGPELKMSLVPKDQESVVKISIVKGKKPVFADDVRISSKDAQKLERYVAKNFANAA
jgi:hypothetical protein